MPKPDLMSFLHLVGFGHLSGLQLKFRWKLHSVADLGKISIESGDAVILNLAMVNDLNQLNAVKNIVASISENGGILLTISAPVRPLSRGLSNFSFLPWSDDFISGIRSSDDILISSAREAPEWVEWLLRQAGKSLITPVFFESIPSGSHVLMSGSGGRCVSLNYRHGKGWLFVMPSIPQILHGESDESARRRVANYLGLLTGEVLSRYLDVHESLPGWLESITVRNESELRENYRALEEELRRLSEEKAILCAYGSTLTRKVTLLLRELGFDASNKEIEGHEDIEIRDGDYVAIVECAGAEGFFKIEKLRQLMQYILEQNKKGIFIGNPWRKVHPDERNLSEAFSEECIDAAVRLQICLVSVPLLYRAHLECTSDDDKARLRESLKKCVDLWDYPLTGGW